MVSTSAVEKVKPDLAARDEQNKPDMRKTLALARRKEAVCRKMLEQINSDPVRNSDLKL